MQEVLKINYDGEDIVSKPFDFEAMCLINDVQYKNPQAGQLRMCKNAVSYMFEGTKVTDNVLNSLSIQKMTSLCMKLWKIYLEVLVEISKNE